MPDAVPTKRPLAPSDAQVREARAPGPAVFDDVLGDPPPDILDLLGGRLYEAGYQDGLLVDLSRNRRIRYRVRYPKDCTGPAAIVLLCHGGISGEHGHTLFADL